MKTKLFITTLLLFNFLICFSQEKSTDIKTNEKYEVSGKEINDRIKTLETVLLCQEGSRSRCYSDTRWNTCDQFNESVKTSPFRESMKGVECVQGLPGGGVLLKGSGILMNRKLDKSRKREIDVIKN